MHVYLRVIYAQQHYITNIVTNILYSFFIITENIGFFIFREEMMVEIIWEEAEVAQEVMVLVTIVIQMSTGVGIDDKAALCKIKLKQLLPFLLPNAAL